MKNYELLWPPCRSVQVVRLRKTWKNMKRHEENMKMTKRMPVVFYAKSMQKAWFLQSSKIRSFVVLFIKNMQKAWVKKQISYLAYIEKMKKPMCAKKCPI